MQRGRSRTWLLDRGWFASIIEFQPSSFGRGSYLNVGAHFLWTWNEYLSFDLGHRVEGFQEYENDEQFSLAVDELVRAAVSRLREIDADLPSVEAALRVLPKSTGGKLMMRFHRAVSHGLGGELGEAKKLLETLVDRTPDADWVEVLIGRCRELLLRVDDRRAFRAWVEEVIALHRAFLKLPTMDNATDFRLAHDEQI